MKKLSLLFALTLFSSVFSFARTYDGNEKIYLRPSAVSWWLNDNAKVGLNFDDGTNNAFVEVEWLVDNAGGNIWSASVPAGNWTNVVIRRYNSEFSTIWDSSGNIAIDATANYIHSFSENSTTATWQTLKAHYRSKTTGNWSALSTWRASFDTNWTNPWNSFDAHVIPNNNDLSVTIMEAHKVTADNTNAVSSLTIKPTGKLTINSSQTLTVSGNFTIESSATGTGTLVDNGTLTVNGTTTAQQYLTPLRNWYMSSPMTAAVIPTYDNPSAIEYYDETVTNTTLANRWINTKSDGTGDNFVIGKGYVVYPGEGTEGYKFEFTGTLNNADASITLTRTTTKTSEVGYNLVGNPYPSYLDAKQLLNNNTNVLPTIWYRTKATNWTFYTYNATGAGISVPADANLDKIPPMQGFWVRAVANNVTLNFDADYRLHNETATSIPLKAPAAVSSQILRLQVTNGTATDEAVIYFNANAQDTFDSYDSPKMMNNGTTVPNLYTTVGTEKLVINGMSAVPYDVQLPLTVQGAKGDYTITANEFSNFAEGDKVQLIDNGIPTDLTPGSSYTFSIAAGENTTGRFSVVFPKSGVPTGVDNAGAGDVTVFTRSSRIVVTANEAAQGSMIYVFNGVGQRLAAQAVRGTVNEIGRTFPAGVYVVKVNNTTAKVVVK